MKPTISNNAPVKIRPTAILMFPDDGSSSGKVIRRKGCGPSGRRQTTRCRKIFGSRVRWSARP
jgi:hypothetical protein